MNTKLLDFTNSIKNYGDVVQILSVKNGIKSDVVSKKTSIIRLTSGGSFFSYLKNIVDSLEPDELIVIACKKIVNQYDKAKEFLFINEQDTPPTLSGLPTSSDNKPMTQIYQFQINSLNDKIARLKKDLDKSEVFKEKYFETKRELDLQEDKHQLNFEKERLKSENTLSGALKEFRPEIQTALGAIAEKFGGGTTDETEQQALGSAGFDPESKLAVVLSIFNSLDGEMFNVYWELVARFGQLSESEKYQILTMVQEQTKDFDSAFENNNQLKNK